jgi:hypothetical protein
MSTFFDRLLKLEKEIVHSFSTAEDFIVLSTTLDHLCQGNHDVAGDFEIVFRQILLSLMHDQGKPIDFIKFSFAFSTHFASVAENIPKIPFLLIEDLLEHQTIEEAKKIWLVVESMMTQITLPVMFNKGKFVMLKICNSLLRKLSKSCHTEVRSFGLFHHSFCFDSAL